MMTDNEAQEMVVEAHLRAFHATREIMKPLADVATKAGDEGGQKLRSMVLAIIINNLINVFTKREKHFPDALVAVFKDEEAREAVMAREDEQKKATVPTDIEALKALKSLFDTLDETMRVPSVKEKVSPGLQDKAAKLRKTYDDIVNGSKSETKAPR